MEIIAIAAQKGGVGKTTTAHNVGAGLAHKGYKVLYVDLDAQGNLSTVLNASTQGATVLPALLRKATAAQVIQHTSGGDIIASCEDLAADNILTSTGKEYRLKEALRGLRGYDYIIIDCPPSLGLMTVNALTAADSCIIPLQADAFSLQSLKQIAPTIDAIRQYTNHALRIRGILLTRYSGRAVLSQELAELIDEQARRMGAKVYKTRIRENVAIKEAQARQQDVYTYSLKSNGAKDYLSLMDEL